MIDESRYSVGCVKNVMTMHQINIPIRSDKWQVKYRVFPREISEKVYENKADDEKSPHEKLLLGVAELRSRAAECS